MILLIVKVTIKLYSIAYWNILFYSLYNITNKSYSGTVNYFVQGVGNSSPLGVMPEVIVNQKF